MHPMFFSVSSSDVEFAEKVWEKFPADWAYLYSKTGKHGVHMWDEIALTELPKARLIVIFWSKNFPSSHGCVREIIQASSLYKSGALKPVIIRLDDFPLFWEPSMEDAWRPAFDALKALADHRASDPETTVEQAKVLIDRMAEPLLQTNHPRMPRHDLAKALRQSLQNDRFTLFPTCWVSGFNGVGRESLVRELCRDLTPNALGTVVEVNETTLPRQLLLQIESEAFGADRERLEELSRLIALNDTKAVAEAVERVSASGNYLILRHGRIVQDEVELPEWLDDVAAILKPSTKAKLFIISPIPLAGVRAVRCKDFIVPFRVPTLNEEQMIELCYSLIGYFDAEPARWSDTEIERVAVGSGGNVGFLVALVRSASKVKNLDHLDAMLSSESNRIVEAITAYTRWAFTQLRGNPDEQKTLVFLNNISPCHILDLDAVVQPKGTIVRVLGRLMELGLVEREAEEIFRLTPLLAARLSRDLIRPELLEWFEDAQKSFVDRPFNAVASPEEGGHELIRLEARIQAALLAGTESLPESFRTFVSAAHWFQAGIRLYHARKWNPAYRMLKKAHENRGQFRDASRMEIDRYYCLAATRMRKYPEAENCITRLKADIRSKPIAAFLQADLHEYKREFAEAVTAYSSALDLNANLQRRREFIYRPLIRCILSTWNPDFLRAEKLAKEYILVRRTVFSLSSLARVYLHWKHRGPQVGRHVPDNIDKLYESALSELEKDPGANAAPFELYAEEAEFTGDFLAALENMDQAILLDEDRFQLRAERWRLMVRSKQPEVAAQAIRELDEARMNQSFGAIWSSYINALAETYARGLIASNRPIALLNGFAPELQKDGELGHIIARTRRG